MTPAHRIWSRRAWPSGPTSSLEDARQVSRCPALPRKQDPIPPARELCVYLLACPQPVRARWCGFDAVRAHPRCRPRASRPLATPAAGGCRPAPPMRWGARGAVSKHEAHRGNGAGATPRRQRKQHGQVVVPWAANKRTPQGGRCGAHRRVPVRCASRRPAPEGTRLPCTFTRVQRCVLSW